MVELTPFQWALRPLKRYAQFKGRAPRAEYWWFYLGTLIGDRVLSFIDKQGGTGDSLASLFSLVILVPWIAVTVRRLHDIDRSGWWLLVLIIPVILLVGLFIQAGIAEIDLVDTNPAAFWPLVALIALGGVTLFVFMVMQGTDGPNSYGADPYGPDQLEEIFA